MTTLACWILGGHSDSAQEQTIKDSGFAGWWSKHVAPATAAIRKLGRDPIVIHRFPGAAFGSFRVTLADFLAVRGTDWASTVKRQTMRPYRWPWQEQRKPVEYRAYLPEPGNTDPDAMTSVYGQLCSAGCGAYFEGVTGNFDVANLAYARARLPFFGCEPFWDKMFPLRWQDPCIVEEKMLTDEGRDFRGKNWNPSWVPLAKGQRRTLIMDDAPVSMAAILEREAEGWEVACYAHRLVELVK